jgi:hypothetical protein
VVRIHLSFQDSLCHQLFSQVVLKFLLAVEARHISVTRDSLLVERAQAVISSVKEASISLRISG